MMPLLDGWDPPTFEGPCGPQQLAEVVLECRRRFVDSCRYGPYGLIGPAGLRQLMQVAGCFA